LELLDDRALALLWGVLFVKDAAELVTDDAPKRSHRAPINPRQSSK
jgi:hypothetical protein